MKQSTRKLFCWWVCGNAAVYGVAGLIKLFSAFQEMPIAQQPDTVFGLAYKWIFIVVGIVEMVCAVFVLGQRAALARNWVIIGWLSANFVAYRTLWWMLGAAKPCPCLGNLLSFSPWLEHFASTALGLVAIAGLAGSVLFQWQSGAWKPPATSSENESQH